MRPRNFYVSWHSLSNAHTYRLLVFKELAFRHLLLQSQLSAKSVIMTGFLNPCQLITYLVFFCCLLWCPAFDVGACKQRSLQL